MLYEIAHVAQDETEATRRWFFDEDLDLLVWQEESGRIIGFQLIYDKVFTPHALTWRQDGGFSHHLVDMGEDRPGRYKSIPILVSDGLFDRADIAGRFQANAVEIDPAVAEFVLARILECPFENSGPEMDDDENAAE